MAKKEIKLPSLVINKTKSSLVRISISEFKGNMYLDIRNNYFDKADGTYKPTPKGISIPIHQGKKLRSSIFKVLEQALALGIKGADGVDPDAE